MDQLSGLKFGESGRIGANKTDIIGNTLVTQLAKAPTWKLPFFANGGPTALATPLPMDMHYGHFHGYHGEPIYKKQNGVFTFRLNPFEENRGSISVQDTKAYEPYDRQIRNTVNAAQSLHNKWKILPLYHYDPRRWMEKSDVPESWETPFKAVNTSIQMSEKKWPFIGFKTYTSLGYMPLDTALPHQVDFYTRCEANGIPIMNHCTTAGMYTHDKPFYYDLWKMDPVLKSKHILDSGIERQEEALKAHISQLHTTIMDLNWTESETKLIQAKLNWFDRHYVYPSAWEPVVSCWKNLRLCLAHFCGYDYFGTKKFPNGSKDEKTGMVYGFPETDPGQFPDKAKTNPLIHGLCQLVRPDNQVHFDVSFFFVTEYNLEAIRNFYHWARGYKNGFMMDRMLWGSDWPLLATDSEKGKYLHEDQLKGYVDMNAKEWINLDPELWLKMAVINPIRFYNLEKLRGHLEKIFEMPAPVAFKSSATTVKELYAQSPRVIK